MGDYKGVATPLFHTADGNLYFMEGDTPRWAITREADNPILQNIDGAFTQLTTKRNYHVKPAELTVALASTSTDVFGMSQLDLKKYDAEFSYFEISTTQYGELNSEQSRVAQRVFGKDNFADNMAMLETAGVNTTRVYVLNPDYIKVNTNDGAVARASWLYGFNFNSYFGADGRSIDNDGCLRGVRRASVCEPVRVPDAAVKMEVLSPPSEIKPATFEEVKKYAARFVPEIVREQFEAGLRNLYKS